MKTLEIPSDKPVTTTADLMEVYETLSLEKIRDLVNQDVEPERANDISNQLISLSKDIELRNDELIAGCVIAILKTLVRSTVKAVSHTVKGSEPFSA